eukprot:113915-Prorocentrum_minimum.AAC.5
MSHKPSALVNSPPQDRIRLALTNKPYKVGSHKQTDIASKDSGPPIAVRGPPIMVIVVEETPACDSTWKCLNYIHVLLDLRSWWAAWLFTIL